MTLQQNPRSLALPAASPTPPVQGRWNWQRVAQGAWIVLALMLLVIFVANIPAYYQSLNIFCTQASPTYCPTGQLTLGNVQALSHLHLSVTAVAGFLATLTLTVSVFVLGFGVGLSLFNVAAPQTLNSILSSSALLIYLPSLSVVHNEGAEKKARNATI